MSRKVHNSSWQGAASAIVLVFVLGLCWPIDLSAQLVQARARIDGMS
jgi:hypothetical protein